MVLASIQNRKVNTLAEAGNLIIRSEEALLHFTILGDIDHHGAKDLRESMDSALFFYRPSRCVINLSRVDFMDSSGLGLILGRYATAGDLGTSLCLEDPSEGVKKILDLAGIERLIDIKSGGKK